MSRYILYIVLFVHFDCNILEMIRCLFCGSFSIGWGPITWVLISEIFPLTIRSRAMSVCTVVNRLMSGTVALTFLSLQDAITPAGAWFFYMTISVISVIFVFCLVPETKGKTLEEITTFLLHLKFSDITGSSKGRNEVEYDENRAMTTDMHNIDMIKHEKRNQNGMELVPDFEQDDDATGEEKHESNELTGNKPKSPIEPIISKDDNFSNSSSYGSTNDENNNNIDTTQQTRKKRKKKKRSRKAKDETARGNSMNNSDVNDTL